MTTRSINTNSECVQLLTLIIFISLVSVGIGCTYTIARIGFQTGIIQTAKTILFFLFLVNGPLMPCILKRNGKQTGSTAGIYAAGVLILIAFLGPAGCLFTVHWAGMVIAGLGLIAFVFNLFLLIRQSSLRSVFLVSGLSAAFTLWLSGRLWGPRIIHPIFLEALSIGKGYIDTLFHIGISQMIRTYGVASTGVDGLAVLHYHIGSHWLFAHWANLLDIPVFDFFLLAYSAVVMPLFYTTGLLLALRLAEAFGRALNLDIRTFSGKCFWLLFFVLSIRLLPDRALANLTIWETFDFSPSQFLGLSLLFLFTVVVLDYWNRPESWIRITLLWIGIPLAIGLLGWMKNSVMILAMAGYGLVLLREGRLRRPAGWIGLALAAIVSFWMLITVTNFGVGNGGLCLFAFLRTYIPFHLLPYHLLVYFGFLILYTILRIHQTKIFSTQSFRTALKNRELLDLEILFVIAFVGILPGLFLLIPNGSAHYFSNIQIRLAIPFILAQSSWIAQRLFSMQMKGLRIVVLMILFILGWKTVSLVGFAIKGNLAIRQQLTESPLAGKRARFLARLRKMDSMPPAEKKRMLIHISRSDTSFWDDFLRYESKQNTSLLIPAVSGVAMLDGLPPDSIKAPYYGFGVYQKRDRHPEGQADLCRAASDLGFEDASIVSFSLFDDAPNIIHCEQNELPE